jgi:Protein of unknown function (DUF1553)/Protein of unknown function (DUF1549)/Planctomycete cytochrome C
MRGDGIMETKASFKWTQPQSKVHFSRNGDFPRSPPPPFQTDRRQGDEMRLRPALPTRYKKTRDDVSPTSSQRRAIENGARRIRPDKTTAYRFRLILWLGVVFLGAQPTSGDVPADGTAVSFNKHVRPILSRKCLACHGPDDGTREANLRLDDPDSAYGSLDSGAIAIVPGKPTESELFLRVSHSDPDQRMPPQDFGKGLTKEEIDTLEQWIAAGARYDTHWSYVPPRSPPIPAIPREHAEWPSETIDLFLLAKMFEHELEPSPPSAPNALCRRVFLDLTGLPPSPEDVTAFVSSTDPRAYEQLVDRLLQSPAFGEHWGRQWLDLARYADSAGYADDPSRTIWAYRDWVIRAINANMPFDQFTILQLAGDLLPASTVDQQIATAFHRNTMTNNEGGTIDEEFRNVAIVDRVNTTMSVWMGTTIACCQCHHHKYDPISQDEYFQVFAYFNNTEDSDKTDESPTLAIYTPSQQARRDAIEKQLANLRQELPAPTATPEPATSASSPESATPGDTQPIAAPERDLVISEANRKLTEQIDALEKELATIVAVTTVPILKEKRSERRVTQVHRRGNYLDPGQPVSEGIPAAFNPNKRPNPSHRLEFAQWLVSQENPLTARVVVNRFWEAIFGRGIVATSEDFGTQGDLPTHPELLDWLAVDFMQHGWDVKRLLRQLVTSSTYRQSSHWPVAARQADPENIWLARAPRVRHSAEMIRDQALSISGLLSPAMFGPPVQPPQPSIGLSAAFGSSTDWQTSQGADRYRRAIYTSWRRSNPYPSLATFDAPNREVCTIRRNRTNTPLQALVTLNDPAYFEAAQALARRALDDTNDTAEAISSAFQRTLARPPQSEELAALLTLYDDVKARLESDLPSALRLATGPKEHYEGVHEPLELSVMTTVMNVILNLDEVVMKR